jgi:hypothetical protein
MNNLNVWAIIKGRILVLIQGSHTKLKISSTLLKPSRISSSKPPNAEGMDVTQTSEQTALSVRYIREPFRAFSNRITSPLGISSASRTEYGRMLDRCTVRHDSVRIAHSVGEGVHSVATKRTPPYLHEIHCTLTSKDLEPPETISTLEAKWLAIQYTSRVNSVEKVAYQTQLTSPINHHRAYTEDVRARVPAPSRRICGLGRPHCAQCPWNLLKPEIRA